MTISPKLNVSLKCVVALVLLVGVTAFAQDATTQPTENKTMVEANKTVTTESGLTIIDKGTDPASSGARAGDQVWVHYTGRLQANGVKFDSSLDRGKPIDFVLGTGSVIKGWDEGIAGMTVGQKRQLIIPADLGYGTRGAGGAIPPGATLVFDVELVGLKRN